MRRIAVFAVMLAAAAACLDARAASTVDGRVAIPSLAPNLARQMFVFSDKLDGVTGDVIALTESDRPRDFEIERTGGATGSENLDIWFYSSLEGNGEPCDRVVVEQPDGGETGTMCAEARYAVVVLFQGADATFRLSY